MQRIFVLRVRQDHKSSESILNFCQFNDDGNEGPLFLARCVDLVWVIGVHPPLSRGEKRGCQRTSRRARELIAMTESEKLKLEGPKVAVI